MRCAPSPAGALSTISTGGFSTHDAAFAFWNSPLLDGVAVVFMVVGGINFALHFTAWRQASLRGYYHDSETRAFLRILAAVVLVATAVLWAHGSYAGIGESLRQAVFMTVSAMTTTGRPLPGWTGCSLRICLRSRRRRWRHLPGNMASSLSSSFRP